MTGSTGTILYLVILVAVFYFFLIRPQQKQRQKRNEMINALGVGSQIYTIGGILGTIVEVRDKEVDLEVADGIIITILKSAIGNPKSQEEDFEDDEDFEEDLEDDK